MDGSISVPAAEGFRSEPSQQRAHNGSSVDRKEREKLMLEEMWSDVHDLRAILWELEHSSDKDVCEPQLDALTKIGGVLKRAKEIHQAIQACSPVEPPRASHRISGSDSERNHNMLFVQQLWDLDAELMACERDAERLRRAVQDGDSNWFSWLFDLNGVLPRVLPEGCCCAPRGQEVTLERHRIEWPAACLPDTAGRRAVRSMSPVLRRPGPELALPNVDAEEFSKSRLVLGQSVSRGQTREPKWLNVIPNLDLGTKVPAKEGCQVSEKFLAQMKLVNDDEDSSSYCSTVRSSVIDSVVEPAAARRKSFPPIREGGIENHPADERDLNALLPFPIVQESTLLTDSMKKPSQAASSPSVLPRQLVFADDSPEACLAAMTSPSSFGSNWVSLKPKSPVSKGSVKKDSPMKSADDRSLESTRPPTSPDRDVVPP